MFSEIENLILVCLLKCHCLRINKYSFRDHLSLYLCVVLVSNNKRWRRVPTLMIVKNDRLTLDQIIFQENSLEISDI